MGMKNEEEIKKKIVEYRDRGVCDAEGNTIPPEKRGHGKGDRMRVQPGTVEKYRENYPRAFGHD